MGTNLILESYRDLVECYHEIERLQGQLEVPPGLLYKIHSKALEAAEEKFMAILDNQVDSRLLELMDLSRRQLAEDIEKHQARQQPLLVAPV